MLPADKLYYKKYPLKGLLEKYVKYAWVMKSQEEQSGQDLLIPDGYPEIIFVRKGKYQKAFLDPKKKPQIIRQSCIVGIQDQTVLASRMDQCDLVGLKLNPIGAYALFGSQLKNISSCNSHIEDFGMDWLSQLNQHMQHCTEEISMINLLTDQLSVRLKEADKNNKITLAAAYLKMILSVDGTITVKELADKHFLSLRQYQRNFKTFFGISPKIFLNIIRFKQLYKSSILEQKLPKNFLEYGYYDQMHFIKDFQKRMGINPSKSSEIAFILKNEIARTSR
jgi:AraC-like DNA-binding protein